MRMQQRGRAIVRRLTPPAERRSFRPGDFLLVRTRGLLPGIEQLATGGALNHAALIVDASGALIEVNPALLPGAHPLRRGHLRDYLDAGEPCWIGYVEAREGSRAAVVEFAESLLAAPARLSELGIAALTLHTLLGVAPRARTARHAWLHALHPFFDRHALVLREEHTYLSGELVARALERGGFVWDCDPAYITPAALFERFALDDAPAQPDKPGVLVPLAEARKAKDSAKRSKGNHTSDAPSPAAARGPARVSPFIPRTSRLQAPGASASSAVPQPDAALMPTLSLPRPAPNGVRTLLQLALLTAGSLAVVHSIEALVRPRPRP